MHLRSEQQRLFELLALKGRCFVRLCETDDSLWVSDLPRRGVDCSVLCEEMRSEGFTVRVAQETGLLYADWTDAYWEKALESLPEELPCLPQENDLHELYALCRLWMLQGDRHCAKDRSMVRRALKLTADKSAVLLRAVKTLHGETAVRLRTGGTIDRDAGRVLAQWLNTCANEKECQR